MNTAIWRVEDWAEDRCSKDQIGKPKTEATTVEVKEVLQELPPATMAEFKQAVLRFARGKSGSFDEFLKANPGFAQKFLLAMAKEPERPPHTTVVKIEAPWITPDRLSYRHAPPPPSIETAKIISESKPEAWKAPPEK